MPSISDSPEVIIRDTLKVLADLLEDKDGATEQAIAYHEYLTKKLRHRGGGEYYPPERRLGEALL